MLMRVDGPWIEPYEVDTFFAMLYLKMFAVGIRALAMEIVTNI